MAAYAAVVSLMHITEQIQVYHARYPIFDDQQQMQLDSLRIKISFLHDFLERFLSGGSREAENLESQITEAIYDAEDLIESHIVDDVHARSTSTVIMDSSDHFSRELKRVIVDLEFIQSEAAKIIQNSSAEDKQPMNLLSVGSSGPPLPGNRPKVALGDALNVMIDKLIGKGPGLHAIPITGMGGIGKTTLTQIVYNTSLIKNFFDIRGWITVAQEFDPQKFLFCLLNDMNYFGNQNKYENMEYHELGDMLYKHLSGRRYLIIMDDIWSSETWIKVKMFFPDNKKGSRIILTTRQLNVANYISASNMYEMNLLDENESWNLLHTEVFHQGSCPSELEEIGKRIAKNCKGLPLSIAVIGRVLARFTEKEYWKSIAEDISARVNTEDGERYLKVLYTSYRELPAHLKPCFLYFGFSQEDDNINVSKLIELWIAEGFLKPQRGKGLEEVARDYLNDLIDRNLISHSDFRMGGVKRCKIHDLLRDLCIREANRQRFLHATKRHEMSQGVNSHLPREAKKQRLIYETKVHDTSTVGFNSHRRIAIHRSKSYDTAPFELDHTLHSSSFIRSFICNFEFKSLPSFDFKLLRVCWSPSKSYPENFTSEFLNSRYIRCRYDSNNAASLPISVLWNLQTIRLSCGRTLRLPFEMLELTQLRHVKIENFKLDGPCGDKGAESDNDVLENLQTLLLIGDFKCSEEVLRRIPNLKKLGVFYEHEDARLPEYLENIGRLTKLESLCLFLYVPVAKLEFPLLIKKLILSVRNFNWEDMGEKIGSLPHLEKLELQYDLGGEEWNPVEEQFPCLKYLRIHFSGLQRWNADSCHFPCLEYLFLSRMYKLEDIPSELGDITTLQLIEVEYCSESAYTSAKSILEEQTSLGNVDLCVITKETGDPISFL